MVIGLFQSIPKDLKACGFERYKQTDFVELTRGGRALCTAMRCRNKPIVQKRTSTSTRSPFIRAYCEVHARARVKREAAKQ